MTETRKIQTLTERTHLVDDATDKCHTDTHIFVVHIWPCCVFLYRLLTFLCMLLSAV